MAQQPAAGPPDIDFQAIIEQSLAGIYVMQDERFVYSNATWAGMAGALTGTNWNSPWQACNNA